jgi:dipeptidyl-peptidase-4
MTSRIRTASLALGAFALLGPSTVLAQQKLLTLDDIYDREKRADWSGRPPSGIAWISDTHYVWAKTSGSDDDERSAEWLKVEARTGRSEPLFDAAKMEAALAKLPGVSREEAKRLSRRPRYSFDAKRSAVLLSIAGDLYVYEFAADKATRLTFAAGEEQEASFSPDAAFVAFVRANNLYLVDVATQRERPVTTDGSEELLNGKLDWVYQEEIYGRGNYRAYWWSPDSSRLAFLQLNEKGVPKYTLVDDIAYRPDVESFQYPKAGDPNPTVKLAVARVAGGAPRFLDLDKYATGEFLIVDVAWTPDSKQVVFQVQDREQTWLDLDEGSAANGGVKTLLRETTQAWVDTHGAPRFLKDGSFLWFSERTGFKHLYHLRADGSLIRQVTDGRWEARTLHGIDEPKGLVYFSGTERSPIGSDVYRIRLDGSGLTRLSQAPGSHSATFNPDFTLYVDSWSDARTPTQVRLHRADGDELRVIDENKLKALAEFRLSRPEFVQVKTRDGFVMEAMLLKPPDFDPRRRYPVYQHTYAGPHAQQVVNRWGGTTGMYHQLLAQKGIVVWICDNRSASGKGAESTWANYKRLGESELQDIEDGIAWLRQQPWVDASRIGINGWSYGGFMVTYALTHSRSFAMGIAGGSVTDWRNYDSIYTERFMRMPQNNPDGYKRTAPRAAAKDLSGNLLLIHGAIDDNVHPQNTMQMAYELQKAGKPFKLMLYPKSRHGVGDAALVKHMRALMLDFITANLLPPGANGTR